MKIEELMVGNIFGYIDEDKLVPVVVKKIDGQSNIVCLRQSDGHIFNTMIDFLLPIPLTPEILEKNGFVYKEGEIGLYGVTTVPHYVRDDVPFEVFCDGEPFAIWFKEPVNIKYLHQLQQALILCRIDKKITLP